MSPVAAKRRARQGEHRRQRLHRACPPVTKAGFLRRWRRDLAHAERTLLRDGFPGPMTVVVGRDGTERIIGMDLCDEAARARSVDMVRLVAVASDAALTLFRAEVWIVVGGELPDGVTPGASDRRVEAVAVAAAARIGESVERRLSLREILRGEDGLPVGLRDLPGSRPAPTLGGVDGWMTDLLAPRRPTQDEQVLAGLLLAAMAQR
jgi:hypothetical protein